MKDRITKKTSFLLMMFLLSGVNYAQSESTFSISGFVYDNTNGEALIAANVYIKELNIGGATNISGYFVIPDIPKDDYTIICSYIGYKTEVYQFNYAKDKNARVVFRLEPTSVQTQDVVVSADSVAIIDKLFNKPVSKFDLSPVQIKNIPQVVEADLLRALQSMPGIVAISDFSSALYVRGGTPDQVLYMIDGTDVYNPEHAFGIFSTFNTNAIKKVEVSKGGFGAEYGGRLSSVVNITNLDGNRNEFEGVANISLLSASTTLQMPIGSIGSLSGSIRRTYLDLTYEKWIDEIPAYYFYDGNIKAYLDFGMNDKLTISFFKGRDDLDYKFDKTADESFEFLYDWGNTTGSINWKHLFSQKMFASFWVTYSTFDSNFDLTALDLKEKNCLRDVAIKASFEDYAMNNLTIKFGGEHKFVYGMYEQEFTQQRIYLDGHRTYSGLYLSAAWKPNDRWDIEPGLRFNYFKADTAFVNFEPRLAIKYRLTEESNLKLAAGRYYQYANRLPRLFFASVWSSVNKNYDVSSSDHLVLSYQHSINNIYEFEAELYYKDYKNLYQFNPNLGTDAEPSYYDANNRPVYSSDKNAFLRGDGDSYGFELLLRKDVGEINGWISYSYSKTEYTFDKINQAEPFIPRHNRSSVVNAVVNFDLNGLLWENPAPTSKWKVGVNFIYASGQPLTLPGSSYYMHSVPDWNDVGYQGIDDPAYKLYPGAINSYRMPDYIRLDLSVTYEKDYGTWQLSPYLQIFNIGNRKNLWFIQYKDEVQDGSIVQSIEKVNMLPILPSLGVTIKF